MYFEKMLLINKCYEYIKKTWSKLPDVPAVCLTALFITFLCVVCLFWSLTLKLIDPRILFVFPLLSQVKFSCLDWQSGGRFRALNYLWGGRRKDYPAPRPYRLVTASGTSSLPSGMFVKGNFNIHPLPPSSFKGSLVLISSSPCAR